MLLGFGGIVGYVFFDEVECMGLVVMLVIYLICFEIWIKEFNVCVS